MCAYNGKEIADACKRAAREEHEAEELIAAARKATGARSNRIAVEPARAVLERSRDLRALEVLDRLVGEEAYPVGELIYLRE